MKKQLLLLCCLLSIAVSQSQTFNDGVLEYTVTSGTNVSVKKYNDICPTGTLTIPSTIVDSGTTYTVTSIRNQAFKNCSSLTSVSIPNSVTYIPTQAFYNSSSLTSVSISNSVTSIGNSAFKKCSSLTSVSIPNSVTSIGSSAFSDCNDLTSVSLPNSITSIGNYVFYDCSGLTSVSIPNSLTSIGNYVFYDCSGLTSVSVNWATPLGVSTDIFQNVDVSTIPLTVPAGTVTLYQAAAVWQDFGSFTVLTTEEFENNINVQLFPNPVNNQLNITLSTDLSLQKIQIYNTLGQLIISSKKPTIDVSNLKGTYFAQIKTDKGNVTKKIIVN